MKSKNEKISIKGARQHNLKNIDVEITRDRLVVITGLSGSGKSSLAFDTLYAEGQRRYVESLSSYARQFLGLMEKPDIDYIEGLSPAISLQGAERILRAEGHGRCLCRIAGPVRREMKANSSAVGKSSIAGMFPSDCGGSASVARCHFP